MSPAMEVHLRLSASLPRRTHAWRAPLIQEGAWGRKRGAKELAALKVEFTAMRAAGKTNKEIRERFNCTNNTIVKLIGCAR